MISRKTTLLLLAAMVAVAAMAGVAWLRTSRVTLPDGSLTAPSEGDWEEMVAATPAPGDAYQPWSESAAREAIGREVAKLVSPRKLDAGAAGALTDTAADVVAAFWSADAARLANLYDRQELVATKDLRAAEGARLFRVKARSVAERPIDYGAVRASLIIADGRAIGSHEPAGTRLTRTQLAQGRGSRDIVSAAATGADVVAVDIPAQVLDGLAGEPIQGGLVLHFAERPDDGEWLLVQIDTYAGPSDESRDQAKPTVILTPMF